MCTKSVACIIISKNLALTWSADSGWTYITRSSAGIKQRIRVFVLMSLTSLCPAWRWNFKKHVYCNMKQTLSTHRSIYASSNCAIIGSYNGLLHGPCQAIIWTNVGMLLIGSIGTNFNEISIEKFMNIHSRKTVWKCHMENGGHFLLASKCERIVA